MTAAGERPDALAVDNVVDALGAHTDYRPVERETSITFAEPDDVARVTTLEPGLAGRLLRHPEFSVGRLRVREGRGMVGKRPRELRREGLPDRIVGVAGELPLGALGVRLSPRSKPGHAEIVTPSVLDEGRGRL